MPKPRNFLIGNGDNLREEYERPRIKPNKSHPYSFSEAKEMLLPALRKTVESFDSLPELACPGNHVTALLTLHPAYIAKSYYPSSLIRGVGLNHLGSRHKTICPKKVTTTKPPTETETVELYVGGSRSDFSNWLEALPGWEAQYRPATQLNYLENVAAHMPEDRIKYIDPNDEEPILEVVLHAKHSDDFVIEGFREFMRELGISPDIDNRTFQVRGLCFMPLRVHKELISEVAKFSFLRAIRQMPQLRTVRPINFPMRSTGNKIKCELPDSAVINSSFKAAIFDGGLPANHPFPKWVNYHEHPTLSKPNSSYLDHGLSVTSAALFGPLKENVEISAPPCSIDHHRVLDVNTGKSSGVDCLYDVLSRIDEILSFNHYDFVNLSIGPYLPIEDDDVHAWTAVLDNHFSRGQTFATIAAGNDGHLDRDSGNARVQVPSDCVNAVAVGACDSIEMPWRRASYSSVGPGRSPGLVKPDFLCFGGAQHNPFFAVSRQDEAVGIEGTSFASPAALRIAMGIKSQMGSQINALGLKALLINRTETNDEGLCDVGWGKIPHEAETLLHCRDGEVRVLYQGFLRPGSYVRAPIPYPSSNVSGMINLTATFCFAS